MSKLQELLDKYVYPEQQGSYIVLMQEYAIMMCRQQKQICAEAVERDDDRGIALRAVNNSQLPEELR